MRAHVRRGLLHAAAKVDGRSSDRTSGVATRVNPPASPRAVEATEEKLGLRIPALLRRLYLELGNGSFGPRGQVLGVRDSDRPTAGIVPVLDRGAPFGP